MSRTRRTRPGRPTRAGGRRPGDPRHGWRSPSSAATSSTPAGRARPPTRPPWPVSREAARRRSGWPRTTGRRWCRGRAGPTATATLVTVTVRSGGPRPRQRPRTADRDAGDLPGRRRKCCVHSMSWPAPTAPTRWHRRRRTAPTRCRQRATATSRRTQRSAIGRHGVLRHRRCRPPTTTRDRWPSRAGGDPRAARATT